MEVEHHCHESYVSMRAGQLELTDELELRGQGRSLRRLKCGLWELCDPILKAGAIMSCC